MKSSNRKFADFAGNLINAVWIGLAHLGVRLVCLFLPKNRRKLVRNWYKWHSTGVVREWFEEVRDKWIGITKNSETVELLAIGSSHGAYGYIPSANAFNLCSLSQDLYLSHELYVRCRKFPRLKTILQFYSVFSPGHMLEKTYMKEKCSYYHKLWGIPYRFHSDWHFRSKDRACDKLIPGGV